MANRIRCCFFALAFLFAGPAHAATIIDTFTGVGSGVLGTDSTFTVTYGGDTAQVTAGGGQLRNPASLATFESGPLFATFEAPSLVIPNADPTVFPAIVFAQIQPSPVFAVAEGLTNPAFPFYDLASNFAPTAGTPAVIPQTFLTVGGNLHFETIPAMTFRAVVAAVTEPATWAMMALVGIVFAAMRGRARPAVPRPA